MAKGFLASAKSFAKNLTKRMGRVATGTESAKVAFEGVTRDTAKLKRALAGPKTTEDRHQAVELAREGRTAYNKKEYEAAHTCFQEAIACDRSYPLAHLYLGHTLYQMGRLSEAVASWERVIQCDPASKEATRAQRKIHHVAKHTEKVVEHLETRLKKK